MLPDLQQAPRRRAVEVRSRELARRYGDALRAAEGAEAERVVREALVGGMLASAVHARIIQPAMVRIGTLWESGAITVADEHLATAITQHVLVGLFDALRPARANSRERVLLAGVQGQHHVLGLRMIADVLEGAGFEVAYLAGDVPASALRTAVADKRPAVVGLAYGMVDDPLHLAAAVCSVHEASPEARIMLGGRAVPALLRDAGYPSVVSSETVVATVESLLAGPAQPPSPVVAALCDRRRGGSRVAPPAGSVDTVAAGFAAATDDVSETAREYVRLARRFEALALRDPVTDLGSRRAFDDRLAQAGDGDALLMIDVDVFKSVNDELGHDAGDRLLRSVGGAIAASVRPLDFVARIGGDEFAVVLPEVELDQARRVGERIRRAVAALRDPRVTVSIGAAGLFGEHRAAMLAADEALYAAKAAGRDRVA